MEKRKSPAEVGGLLLSEPFMIDEFYRRSVILLTRNSKKEVSGFFLNKQTNVKVNDAVHDFPYFDTLLYFGGPYDTDTMFYVHTLGEKLEHSAKISDGLYFGGNYDQLKFLIDTNQVKQNQIRFYAGCMMWNKPAFNREIREKTWLQSKVKKEFAFFEKHKELWAEVLRSMGNEYRIISHFPEDPTLN